MNVSGTRAGDANARPRYVVGIDLGTTNSAACFVDTSRDAWRVETFHIPQLIAPGQTEARETLPSFHYQATQGEFPQAALRLPWSGKSERTFVGLLAREQGKQVPGRVIDSAKSWLCHPGVDRTSPLLPWRGADDVAQLSPVEVSAAYLSHIRAAWNHAHPNDPFELQEIVVTLPASFDEVARELTVDAARKAGIARVHLIEEPQAAFYQWINAHRDDWSERVQPGQNVLVCDVGGGTSDFTLIRVRSHPTENVQFHRVAVGTHLILGGDNLDLALAQRIEQRLTGGESLPARSWGSLVRICRQVKETLLSADAPESYAVMLPGGGAKLIGGGLSAEVTRDEVRDWLLEGFFPQVALTDRPQQSVSGFQEFGLPYAPDPGVTRYLAAFLDDHFSVRHADDDAESSPRPDVVLFNGGVFVSPVIRERVIDSIRNWFAAGDPDWSPLVLENDRHDLAVARGAAYYGMVRRGEGVRIAAGLPRTYYIGVGRADELHALCLVPAGVEPGYETSLDQQELTLTVAAPVEFPLFHSSLRQTDAVGALVPIEREQMSPLPPIRTVIKSRKHQQGAAIAVHLHARLTEIGTLQLWCSEVNGNRSWQLQFDVRSATQTDVAAHTGTGEAAGVLDQESWEGCRQIIEATFGPDAEQKPGGLPKRIARGLDMSRDDWPPALLRQIWEVLMDLEDARNRSAEHEARWLNLLGFSMRPGFGLALDDWRVSETWKLLQGRLLHPGPTTLSEWWILWRRLAGGLTTGQQQAIANPLLTNLRDDFRRSAKAGRQSRPLRGVNTHELSESWRMLGSLERLTVRTKEDLGRMILHWIDDPHRAAIRSALTWALGRIGSRDPFHGPLNRAVPIDVAGDWIEYLVAGRERNPDRQLAVMLISRRTGDRYRDIDESLRNHVLNWLSETEAPRAIPFARAGHRHAQQADRGDGLW